MIAAIRISGDVKITEKIRETLFRMRLRRKYSLVLIKPTEANIKILRHVRDYVAYGTIDKKTLSDLLESRAQPIKKGAKINVLEVISKLDKSSFQDLGIKPFFRLHPPRKGIDSKNHFGTSRKAVLGDNREKINDLIRRML